MPVNTQARPAGVCSPTPAVNTDPDLLAQVFDMVEAPGGTVAYRSILGRMLGSATAGLLLSQFLYWSRTGVVIARGGWFWKKRHEIWSETGLTRDQQETARRLLVGKGILIEERRGLTRNLWFRVDLARLLDLLRVFMQAEASVASTSSEFPLPVGAKPADRAPSRMAGKPPSTETTQPEIYERQHDARVNRRLHSAPNPMAAIAAVVSHLSKNSGQQQKATYTPDEAAVAEALERAGMKPYVIPDLLQRFGVDEARHQLTRLSRVKYPVKSRGGWLRKAIERRDRDDEAPRIPAPPLPPDVRFLRSELEGGPPVHRSQSAPPGPVPIPYDDFERRVEERAQAALRRIKVAVRRDSRTWHAALLSARQQLREELTHRVGLGTT